MKIASWNVAGLRARIKSYNFDFLYDENIDILCIQETKCECNQIKLNEIIENNYPYRQWASSNGTTQRKGLSGTCIWSKIEPINIIPTPCFDSEGRLIVLEFEKFVLINIYVPNSQSLTSDRFSYRENFNNNFSNYVNELKTSTNKELVLCGDFNVALTELDVSNSKQKLNKVAGHLQMEITMFNDFLKENKLTDIFRVSKEFERISTYWSNFLKQKRSNTNGWRLDYILITYNLVKIVKSLKICDEIMSSDHCPMLIEFESEF